MRLTQRRFQSALREVRRGIVSIAELVRLRRMFVSLALAHYVHPPLPPNLCFSGPPLAGMSRYLHVWQDFPSCPDFIANWHISRFSGQDKLVAFWGNHDLLVEAV